MPTTSTYPDQTFATKAAAVSAMATANYKRWLIITADETKGGVTGFYFFDGAEIHDINLAIDLSGYARLGASLNTFVGDVAVNGDIIVGASRITNFFGENIFYQNCKLVDQGGGIYEVQSTGGVCSYFVMGPDGFAVYSGGAALTGAYPQFKLVASFTVAGGAVFHKQEVIYVNSSGADPGKVVSLDSHINAVEYAFTANPLDAGTFFDFWCANDVNGVQCVAYSGGIEAAVFYLKNDTSTPVSRFNLYKGNTMRIYHNGTTFREW